MKASSVTLENLMRQGDLWRGGAPVATAEMLLPCGLQVLDELLSGGWPLGVLTEILSKDHLGVSLLLPGLGGLPEAKWLAWVNPPFVPYAPTLAVAGLDVGRVLCVLPKDSGQTLWAAEQAMRSGACAAVLTWAEGVKPQQVRRLQLAAEQGKCLAVLFRPVAELDQPSHAALRLVVAADPAGLSVRVARRRGSWAGNARVLC